MISYFPYSVLFFSQNGLSNQEAPQGKARRKRPSISPMRAASPQTVDRLLGVFVAVCASAVIAAFGARIGPSFSAFLRLAYDGYASNGESSAGSEKGRGDSPKKRRSRGRRRSSAENEDTRRQDGSGEGDNADIGDDYFAYAYGSRSSSLRSGTAVGVAAGDAAAVGGRRGLGAVLVVHAGSCHCGELAFEVQAPEHLVALEGPSKVKHLFVLLGVRFSGERSTTPSPGRFTLLENVSTRSNGRFIFRISL